MRIRHIEEGVKRSSTLSDHDFFGEHGSTTATDMLGGSSSAREQSRREGPSMRGGIPGGANAPSCRGARFDKRAESLEAVSLTYSNLMKLDHVCLGGGLTTRPHRSAAPHPTDDKPLRPLGLLHWQIDFEAVISKSTVGAMTKKFLKMRSRP